jgi:hypothetical protein
VGELFPLPGRRRLLAIELRRAFVEPQLYRAKVLASILAGLSLFLFVFLAPGFSMSASQF